jgi:hypothetical protein
MNDQTTGIRSNLLSSEEEAALARLRDIVERLRAKNAAVEVSSMVDDIRAAGGKRVHSPEVDGPDTFMLGGAHFSLRPSPTAKGKIEVLFLPGRS